MDGHKSHMSLTRTKSSLLRSSPTVRSSIQSLSSVSELNLITPEEDEEKPHKKPGPIPGWTRFAPLLALSLLAISLLSFYLVRHQVTASEDILFTLIFVAVLIFYFGKNAGSIHQAMLLLRQTFRQSPKPGSKSVQWFIGDSVEEGLTCGEPNKVILEGVELYSNGDSYEGEFNKGKCNGSGVYNYFVNGRYEGDWINGRYDGLGIEGWARGSRYRGQYRNGLRHGFGNYRFYTGDCYAGEWFNGQSHGIGMQTCSDGSSYFGEFKSGAKHGLGCYHFRNGDRYCGEYFGDKIHGFGVYHFANVHCYEGSWHEGRRQGYGMYTFRKGDKKSGEWDGGTLKNPLHPLSDSILRAVQAARKAAKNAINLRRVDAEVNKAVTAANRAATAARVAAVKAVQNRMDRRFCVDNLV